MPTPRPDAQIPRGTRDRAASRPPRPRTGCLGSSSVHQGEPVLVTDVVVEELALGERAPHGVVGFLRDLEVPVTTSGYEHDVELMLDGIVAIGPDDARGHERETRARPREFPPCRAAPTRRFRSFPFPFRSGARATSR